MEPVITKNGPEHTLKTKVEIEKPIKQVFSFFSNPKNLELMTPSLLNFKIIDLPDLPLKEGSLIAYKLKIRGFPIRWKTLISKWDPPHLFEDIQLKGPYRKWVHQHIFYEHNGNTVMEDFLKYKVLGGHLINKLFVEKDILKIFKYRTDFLKDYFS